MQTQILVIQVSEIWKWSSKCSSLRTYIVGYYLTLKIYLLAKYSKESDKKYAKWQNDKLETAEFYRKTCS